VTNRMVCIQFRAIGEYMISKSVQILDPIRKPGNSFGAVCEVSGDNLHVLGDGFDEIEGFVKLSILGGALDQEFVVIIESFGRSRFNSTQIDVIILNSNISVTICL